MPQKYSDKNLFDALVRLDTTQNGDQRQTSTSDSTETGDEGTSFETDTLSPHS